MLLSCVALCCFFFYFVLSSVFLTLRMNKMKKECICLFIYLCLRECCSPAKCYSLAHGLNVTVYRPFLYRINVVPLLSELNVQETQPNLDPFIRANDWPLFSARRTKIVVFIFSNKNQFRIKSHTNKYAMYVQWYILRKSVGVSGSLFSPPSKFVYAEDVNLRTRQNNSRVNSFGTKKDKHREKNE